jgi:hypothetical protein
MSYFEDLSDYSYHGAPACRPVAKNVGWLRPGHAFDKATPTETTLDEIWECCSVSVAQTRGMHCCEFCSPEAWDIPARHGKRLLLGTSEIRVFAKNGTIYAAPTLLYHYALVHHYRPPDEFLRALHAGPRPPDPEYFERLERMGLEWNFTSVPAEGVHRQRLNALRR